MTDAGRASVAGADQDAGPLLTIGEVLAHLADEFGDVTHSKVRFLEDRGLVSPQRSPSGYRKFTAADVERLRVVLRLQRDQYLPLRVIREHLVALDAGREPPPLPGAGRSSAEEPAAQEPPAASSPSSPPAASSPSSPGWAPRAAVVAAAGGSPGLVEALEGHGLLPHATDGLYPPSAVEVAAAASSLGEHGIEPRHLRALRTAVGHQAALVEQVVSPLRRRADGEVSGAGGRAEEVGAELVSALLALQAAALGCALAQAGPPS